jgi:phospholipid/cholesterol/gamma-HCH transport system permease protein
VRQILFTGVEALGFVGFIALLTGASIVLQAQVLLPQFGTSDMMGPLLVTIVIRELGPLLINIFVIARSGNAIAIELGQMKIHGEIRALRIQGIDPGIYLVMPRVLALCVSIVCLTIYFCAASLTSGWLLHVALQRDLAGSFNFLDSVAGAIGTADVLNVIAKTVAPALAIGMISCTEGLNVGVATDVPQAASRAIKRSVIWVCVISAFVSALTYL